MNKQPEQTARTRQTIIDAFWELAKESGLHKVTVSAITKKASLNRGTFYVYFSDMEDLLRQAESDIIHDFQAQMFTILSQEGFPEMNAVSMKLLEFFALYDDKVFLLLGKNGDPNFLSLIRKEAAKVYAQILSPLEPLPHKEYIIAYVTSALTGILTYWHDTGRKIPVGELVQISRSLATTGLIGTIGL